MLALPTGVQLVILSVAQDILIRKKRNHNRVINQFLIKLIKINIIAFIRFQKYAIWPYKCKHFQGG